jgi:hypothetical protein
VGSERSRLSLIGPACKCVECGRISLENERLDGAADVRRRGSRLLPGMRRAGVRREAAPEVARCPSARELRAEVGDAPLLGECEPVGQRLHDRVAHAGKTG